MASAAPYYWVVTLIAHEGETSDYQIPVYGHHVQTDEWGMISIFDNATGIVFMAPAIQVRFIKRSDGVTS